MQPRTQHHLSANPHLPWPTKKGAREGNLNAGEVGDGTRVVLIISGGLMGSVGFFRLMANRLRSNNKYLGVSDFGTRECLYLVTTGR